MYKVIIVLSCFIALSLAAPEPQLRVQPELDSVDVESYLKNQRLFNLQLKCLSDRGPCDVVGKWLKPRIARGLMGECTACTPKQEKMLQRVLEDVQTNKPEIYREMVIKYLQDAGISVDGDKDKMAEEPMMT